MAHAQCHPQTYKITKKYKKNKITQRPTCIMYSIQMHRMHKTYKQVESYAQLHKQCSIEHHIATWVYTCLLIPTDNLRHDDKRTE